MSERTPGDGEQCAPEGESVGSAPMWARLQRIEEQLLLLRRRRLKDELADEEGGER